MRKFIKKVTALILVITMVLSSALIVRANTEQETLLFPLRQIFEDAGGSVYWDSPTRGITLAIEGVEINLVLNSPVAYINGQELQLQTGPFLQENTAYVTIDDLAILLGIEADMLLLAFAIAAEEEGDVPAHLPTATATAAIGAQQVMDIFSIPGITIAIVDANNGFTWTQGFGYADTTQNIPVDEQTLFNLASISKPFTAIAVMQLVEAGLIDLDEPVITYLPEFFAPPSFLGYGDYSNITVRMLLSHASGLPADIIGLRALTADEYYQGFMNNFLENLATFPMATSESTMFTYGNNNFTLLGIMVAALTGYDNFFEGYVNYMQQNIFAPLGMDMSTFALQDAHMPYLARPYISVTSPDAFVVHNALPTAGIFSNAHDMARFMHMVLNNGILNGVRVLSHEAVEQMFERADFNFESELDFMIPNMHPGLGFVHTVGIDGYAFTGHGGNLVHYHSNMVFDRETGIGVLVSVNSISGMAAPELLATLILQTAVMEKTGTLNIPPSDETVVEIELSQEELEAFEGHFFFVGGSEFAQVTVTNGVLVIYNALGVPAIELLPLSDGSFIAPELELHFWFSEIDGGRVIYVGEFKSLLLGVELILEDLTAADQIEMWIGTYYPVVEGNEVSLIVRAVVDIDENDFVFMRMYALHGMVTISALPYFGDDNFGGLQFTMEDDEAWMSLAGLQLRRAE